MSKLNFKRLSRGVKLLTNHIHTQIQSALTLITSSRVPQENLQKNAGVTRMTFSWPVAKFQEPGIVSAAFNLVPPQESFREDGILDPDDPTYILDTLSFGFDVRDEAARITSAAAAAGEGQLDFVDAEKLAFKITIYEKTASTFGGDANFDKTVFSLDLPSTLYLGAFNRSNPLVLSDIGVTINPYRTYLLAVDCNTYLDDANVQVNGIVTSLTFRSELRERDSGSANVQNIPQSPELAAGQQYGQAYTDPKTVVVPAGATPVISAEASASDTGVQGGLELIDTAVRKGLTGGYSTRSRRFGYETLKHDAAYQVIAVPMWGNGWFIQKGSADNALLPYMGAALTDTVVDRRIIPIHHPMVIHHVVCCLNYAGINPPTTATHSFDIGVGIGCGIRSDSHSYRQVARATITAATTAIDSYDGSGGLGLISGVKGSLYNVPLVGTGGTGFATTTGKPFFVGQSTSMEEARSGAASVVGGGNTTISSIDGKEQWIEVRMGFEDTAGIDNMPAGEGLVGYGGHWVYIIGKRQVC